MHAEDLHTRNEFMYAYALRDGRRVCGGSFFLWHTENAVTEAYKSALLLRIPPPAPQHELLVVEAADARYKQVNQCISLGGVIDKNATTSPEIDRRVMFAWVCFKTCGRRIYKSTSCAAEADESPDIKG